MGKRWAICMAGAAMCAAMWMEASTLRMQEDGGGQSDRPGMPAGAQMVRGTVTAPGAQAIAVKTERGEIYKVTVTPNTRLVKGRQPVKLAEVKAGDGVGAMGVMDAATKTLHALFVTVMDAEQLKRAQAELGKTYIVGEVTAMDELKLTIRRGDGVSQTIAVDEGTSFRRGGRGMRVIMGPSGGEAEVGANAGQTQRAPGQGEGGGESITLADIKVGDAVVGRGALKGGVFVPTELRVTMGRQGRRGGASGSPDGAHGGATAPVPPGGVQR